MAVTTFLDTSVLLAGLIDFGPQSAPAQSLMHAVAEKQVKTAATAWHCCLEFFSVATRLPPEYRVTPSDAVALLDQCQFFRVFSDFGAQPHQQSAPLRGGQLAPDGIQTLASGTNGSINVGRIAALNGIKRLAI